YRRLDIPAFVATKPEDLAAATKIVLPGVGAFDQAMAHLEASGLRGALSEAVIEKKVPLLGVCVGMQLLAEKSDEGALPGLGWIAGNVRRFDQPAAADPIRLPHMGWNDVRVVKPSPLFEGLEEEAK